MENQPNSKALSLTGVSFSRKEKPLVQIPPPAPLYSNRLVVFAGEFLVFLRFGSSGFFQQEVG